MPLLARGIRWPHSWQCLHHFGMLARPLGLPRASAVGIGSHLGAGPLRCQTAIRALTAGGLRINSITDRTPVGSQTSLLLPLPATTAAMPWLPLPLLLRCRHQPPLVRCHTAATAAARPLAVNDRLPSGCDRSTRSHTMAAARRRLADCSLLCITAAAAKTAQHVVAGCTCGVARSRGCIAVQKHTKPSAAV